MTKNIVNIFTHIHSFPNIVIKCSLNMQIQISNLTTYVEYKLKV